jgi:hypothetical protein
MASISSPRIRYLASKQASNIQEERAQTGADEFFDVRAKCQSNVRCRMKRYCDAIPRFYSINLRSFRIVTNRQRPTSQSMSSIPPKPPPPTKRWLSNTLYADSPRHLDITDCNHRSLAAHINELHLQLITDGQRFYQLYISALTTYSLAAVAARSRPASAACTHWSTANKLRILTT